MNQPDATLNQLNLVAYAIERDYPQTSIDIRIEHLIYRLQNGAR